MLHPVALKHLGAAVVHVDRHGDRQSSLGVEQPRPLVLLYADMVGDGGEDGGGD